MLPHKPHTFLMGDRSQVLDGIVVISYQNSDPVHEIPCQITPDTQGRAFTDFGVEGNNPHMLLADPEWYSLIKKGNVGEFGGRRFVVNVDPKLWNAEFSTASVEVVIEELK